MVSFKILTFKWTGINIIFFKPCILENFKALELQMHRKNKHSVKFGALSLKAQIRIQIPNVLNSGHERLDGGSVGRPPPGVQSFRFMM